MSAFLGPIHTWLFQKIWLQEELVQSILAAVSREYPAELDEYKKLSQTMDERFGVLEKGELADIVDPNNIHGWLQERVRLVEYRLAYVVSELVKGHPEIMEAITSSAFEFGKKYRIEEANSAKDVWKAIKDRLLDGMPCDRVNEMITESEDVVSYHVVQDIHGDYWEQLGGNVDHYILIKMAVIGGMLDHTPFGFERKDNTYQIMRCA
jgi:hypothetical protein